MLNKKLAYEYDDSRLVDIDTARKVVDLIYSLSQPMGGTSISIRSWHATGQRWSRNRASMSSDQRDIRLSISRFIDGGSGSVTTNQVDRASLESAVRYAEERAIYMSVAARFSDMPLGSPDLEVRGKNVWSDKTYNRTNKVNGELVSYIARKSEAASMLSAGYIETGSANSYSIYNQDGKISPESTAMVTRAMCSMTIREPRGNGSGWAGNASFDLGELPLHEIADKALDKCIRSINPVRIEPGRYTTILEPQASATFFNMLTLGFARRVNTERGPESPFYLDYDGQLDIHRSKLGLRIVDPRITIKHSPEDPLVGTHPTAGMRDILYVNQGILNEMAYQEGYAREELVSRYPQPVRSSYSVMGGTVTMNEMIESTERGLIVTRFSDPSLVQGSSMLYTGLTRDGLWLVENGKITNAVRNFRWTESPLFILNNLESLGLAVPIFEPSEIRYALGSSSTYHLSLNNVVVPTIKVKDFSFTSTIDAI